MTHTGSGCKKEPNRAYQISIANEESYCFFNNLGDVNALTACELLQPGFDGTQLLQRRRHRNTLRIIDVHHHLLANISGSHMYVLSPSSTQAQVTESVPVSHVYKLCHLSHRVLLRHGDERREKQQRATGRHHERRRRPPR